MTASGAAALLAAVVGAAAPARAHSPEPKNAEYAVRWDPARGTVATPEDALAFLGARGGKPELYEVRYYDLAPPAGSPPDAAVILRRRSGSGGETEIRLKYRAAHPLADFRCPEVAAFDAKAQLDVGFGAGAPSRVYSYSCVTAAAEPPAALRAVPKPCASKMARYETDAPGGGKYKLEVWTLPDGATRLEISRTAGNSDEELEKFKALVARLRTSGVTPLDVSKTELGSRCPAAN